MEVKQTKTVLTFDIVYTVHCDKIITIQTD